MEIAAASGAFGSRQLRAALASSPLWGAGRVEDPYNLLGHALRKALGVIARQQGRGLPAVATEVGAAMVSGSSLKAALDVAWDEPTARQQALSIIWAALNAVAHWLTTQPTLLEATPEVAASVAVAHQVRAQDVTLLPERHIARRRALALPPVRALSCFRRGRLVIVAALCTDQALPRGSVLSEPWPRSGAAQPEPSIGQPQLPNVA